MRLIRESTASLNVPNGERLNKEINWTTIAKRILGRSAKQCRERWSYNLDPDVNKSEWTPMEDRTLVEAQKNVGNKWAMIAGLLPGRTENGVKTRYKSIVRAKQRMWKPEEDQILNEAVRTHKNDWTSIAKSLPGRTKNAAKMRFKHLQSGEREEPELGDARQIFYQNGKYTELYFDDSQAGDGRGGGASSSSSAGLRPPLKKQRFDAPSSAPAARPVLSSSSSSSIGDGAFRPPSSSQLSHQQHLHRRPQPTSQRLNRSFSATTSRIASSQALLDMEGQQGASATTMNGTSLASGPPKTRRPSRLKTRESAQIVRHYIDSAVRGTDRNSEEVAVGGAERSRGAGWHGLSVTAAMLSAASPPRIQSPEATTLREILARSPPPTQP